MEVGQEASNLIIRIGLRLLNVSTVMKSGMLRTIVHPLPKSRPSRGLIPRVQRGFKRLVASTNDRVLVSPSKIEQVVVPDFAATAVAIALVNLLHGAHPVERQAFLL